MITSLSNLSVKRISALNSKERLRREEGVFITEGVRMFMEAPLSRIEQLFVTEDFAAQAGEAVGHRLNTVGYETVSREVMAKMSDTSTPQGVLCVVKSMEYTMEQVMSGSLLVLLEGLQDPGNLGTIFRTAEAAGAKGIILSKECVSIYNPKSVRATMGTLFRMPFIYTDELVKDIEALKVRGFGVYAAHLKGELAYDEYDYTAPTAFIIGNEGAGISEKVAEAAGQYLKIPMEGEVESLNAAVAASVLLYEIHRQRKLT